MTEDSLLDQQRVHLAGVRLGHMKTLDEIQLGHVKALDELRLKNAANPADGVQDAIANLFSNMGIDVKIIRVPSILSDTKPKQREPEIEPGHEVASEVEVDELADSFQEAMSKVPCPDCGEVHEFSSSEPLLTVSEFNSRTASVALLRNDELNEDDEYTWYIHTRGEGNDGDSFDRGEALMIYQGYVSGIITGLAFQKAA